MLISIFYFIVNSVAKNQFDFLIGDVTISKERVTIVDFSTPIQTSDVVIFMKKNDEKKFSIFSFLQPLSNGVWIAIFLSLVVGRFKHKFRFKLYI